MTRSVWIISYSKNRVFEYLVKATPQELETAIRQFQNEGYCDCSLIEEIIEKSHSYRVCAVCGRKIDELV
jgi:NADH pyrophosphatase NudC (nudix superfamily)